MWEKCNWNPKFSFWKKFLLKILFSGFLLYKLHNAHTDKNEQHQDEAGINSFIAMCDTMWLPVIVWETFCFEQKLSRFFSLQMSIKIMRFGGFSHHFHHILLNYVYRCHTCMKSCICQLSFGTKIITSTRTFVFENAKTYTSTWHCLLNKIFDQQK